MKTLRLFFLVFALPMALLPSLKAGDLYILFDPSCMDRLEYTFQGRSGSFDYVYYQINISANEKLILEIGNESEQPTNYLPSQFINCGNAGFGQSLVQDVNRKIDQVYLVRQDGRKRYFISPVNMAAYYRYDGQVLTYNSPEYQFEFNLKSGVIGEDLATAGNAASEIYFEGMLMRDCTGSFIFRHFSPKGAVPHSDVVIIPEIGIVEERSGLNVEDAYNSVLTLKSINGKSFEDHLYQLCNGKPPMRTTPPVQDSPATGSMTVKGATPQTFDEAPASPASPQPKSAAAGPCEEVPGDGYHVVQKGENLYRISLRYNVNVSQLKSWNSLNTNMIYPCDKLRVAPQGREAVVEMSDDAAPVRNAVAAPAPYEETAGRMTEKSGAVNASWKSGENYHVVQRGETVPYLAMKYGYTESRFRDINNLGPDDFLKIGQVLKTCDCPASAASEQVAPDQRNGNQMQYTSSSDFTRKAPAGYDYYSRPPQIDESRFSTAAPAEVRPSSFEATDSRIRAKGASVSASLADRMGGSSYESSKPQSYEAASSSSRLTHVVREGENLDLIARIYGLSVNRLRSLNDLGPNEVVIPNQRIFIN